jgi:hypothetical protein
MTDLPTLRAWLGSLDEVRLQALLERNPIALAGARVRTLDELASRLAHPAAVSRSLVAAPMPVTEVVEAAGALGAAATVTNLVALLDDAGADADTHRGHVLGWLEAASTLGLAWADGDQVGVNPGVDQVVLSPLALGRPSRSSLDRLTSDGLARLLSAWHEPAPSHKAERSAAAAHLFSDLSAIRRVASGAPDEVLDTLTSHVAKALHRAHPVIIEAFTGPWPGPDGEYSDDDDNVYYDNYYDPDAYRARQELWEWATSAGLAIGRDGLGYGYHDVDLPSEVYLALAPASFRAPFHPEPPSVALADVPAERIERASGASAGQFLGTAMAVLEAVAREGMALRRSGGVGSRELNRFAKQLGTDVPAVRLTLALAAKIGLIRHRAVERVGTTREFQTWRRLPPEQRVVDLVLAWMSPGSTPTLERDASGSYLPALDDTGTGFGIPTGLVLTQLVAEFSGRAVVVGEEITRRLTWSFPVTGAEPGALECVWAEAHVLGVLADGAVAPFAGALCLADDQRAHELLAAVLPGQSGQVLFGSDLTIVIPGDPAPDVVDVLDVVAHRERHGVANTWRVSDRSVRDALDSGYQIDDLTAALRTIAGQDLPQPLEYLLKDVARRYGQLQVRPAVTVITCDDPTLLAEVTGTRRLRKLGLVSAAPTVALTAVRSSVVLRELRAAGYLPIETDGDGVRTVALRRLDLPGRGGDGAGATRTDRDLHAGGLPSQDLGPDDALDEALRELAVRQQRANRPAAPESPADAARRLLSGDDDLAAPPEAELSLAGEARHLTPAEVHELADAVATGRAVQIRYESQSGGETVRVVSDLTVLGPTLYAYCHLRQDERYFRLDRILGVAPVTD